MSGNKADTAIVADERQALEMVRRLTGPGRGQVSIRDVFGDEIDLATLRTRLSDSEHDPH